MNWKQMTCGERLSNLKNRITLEPIIACYYIARLLYEPAINQLELEVACRKDAGFNDTVCTAILSDNHESVERENQIVQTYNVHMQSWTQAIRCTIPMLYLITFIGTFSDRYKIRKPFLLLPLCGEVIGVLGCMINVHYKREWSINALGSLQAIVPSLFGGLTVLVMAEFSYISDITTLETRTMRIGVIHVIQYSCDPIVQSFSGILFKLYGYYANLSIALIVLLIGLSYGYVRIKDTRRDALQNIEWGAACDSKNITDAFRIFNNPHYSRLHVISVMLVYCTYFGIQSGEGSIMFLYTQEVLQWTAVNFAYFDAFRGAIRLIGSFTLILLFVNYLKLSDYLIIIIALIDKSVGSVVYSFATNSTILYAGAFVCFVNEIGCIAISALATKVVASDDVGKAQSLFAICEAFGGALANPFYNTIVYNNTINVMPGAFFLVSAFLLFLCTLIMLWLYKSYIKKINNTTNEHVKEIEDNNTSLPITLN